MAARLAGVLLLAASVVVAAEPPQLDGPVKVAVGAGGLHPARAVLLEVAAEEQNPSTWSLSVSGASWRALPSRGRVGRLLVVPDVDAGRIAVAVEGLPEVSLPVSPEPAPTLAMRPATGWVRDREVVVEVEGAVRPEHLQVVLGEGRVDRVRAMEGGLRLWVSPGEEPWPRRVPIGVRDLSREGSTPVWGHIQLRSRPVVPVTTEPGTSVTLAIGRRSYGPFVAPSDGKLSVPMVQNPDDRTARIVLKDPQGNETRRSLPLTSGRPEPLLAFVDGAWVDGMPAPSTWVRLPPRASDATLRCQAPRHGPLQVARLSDPRVRRVALPLEPPADGWELRVHCETSEGSEVSFSVPRAEGVPESLRVRVWPEVLSADLPVADVAVTLDNGLGERVEPRGRIAVTARYGEVMSVDRPGAGLRAEYRGHLVSEVGQDVLDVAWFAPAGERPCLDLQLASVGPRPGGQVALGVRALDALRRPLSGVDVGIRLGDHRETGVTGDDGWVSLVWPAGVPPGVHRVTLLLEGRPWGEALWDTVAADREGPGQPDLVRQHTVRVDPGRVAEVSLQADPRRVDAGTRRTVSVQARFLDRNGLPAADPRPSLVVPEGSAGEPTLGEDGAFAWDWRPGPGLRPRDVTLVARSEALDLEDAVRVRVAPREIRRFVSAGAGIHTNFGRLVTSRVDLSLGWVVPLRAEDRPGAARPALVVGAGIGWYGQTVRADLLDTEDGRLRMDLLPVSGTLGIRQSFSLHAVWAGASLVVAPWIGRTWTEDRTLGQSVGVLSPGVEGVLGYGVRVPSGELAAEVRVSSLSSPGVRDGFRGWVGGLSTGLSWRVAY